MGQVLLELGKLSTQVAVIQTKQDSLREKIDSLPLADHELRIRSLEHFKWALAGAVTLGGAAAGWVASLLFHSIHG